MSAFSRGVIFNLMICVSSLKYSLLLCMQRIHYRDSFKLLLDSVSKYWRLLPHYAPLPF